jgi:hypothetical protein
MPPDRINTARYLNDNSQAQRTAREQLKFILANGQYLLKVRGGEKYFEDAKDFIKMKDNFTEPQLSFIDVIYEKTMKGLGFESYSSTFKPKKGLRF